MGSVVLVLMDLRFQARCRYRMEIREDEFLGVMEILQPPGWVRPKGYVKWSGRRAGRMVFVSSVIGWDANGAAGRRRPLWGRCGRRWRISSKCSRRPAAGPAAYRADEHGTVVDKHEYIGAYKEIGAVYRELMGAHYPAMTALQVAALLEDQARVEIEATAVLPVSAADRNPA